MRVSRTRFSGYCRLLSRLGQQAASSYGESQWGFVFHPEPFIAKSESGKWFFAVPFQIFYDKNHFTKFNLQNLHNLLFTLCAKTSKRKKNLQMLIFQNLFHKTSLFLVCKELFFYNWKNSRTYHNRWPDDVLWIVNFYWMFNRGLLKMRDFSCLHNSFYLLQLYGRKYCFWMR